MFQSAKSRNTADVVLHMWCSARKYVCGGVVRFSQFVCFEFSTGNARNKYVIYKYKTTSTYTSNNMRMRQGLATPIHVFNIANTGALCDTVSIRSQYIRIGVLICVIVFIEHNFGI